MEDGRDHFNSIRVEASVFIRERTLHRASSVLHSILLMPLIERINGACERVRRAKEDAIQGGWFQPGGDRIVSMPPEGLDLGC